MRAPLFPRPRSALVTLVDLIAIAGLCAALFVAYSGGDRFRLAGLRISLRDPWRIAAWGAGIALIRWALWWRVPFLPSFRDSLHAAFSNVRGAVRTAVGTTRREVVGRSHLWLEAWRESAFGRRADAERRAFANPAPPNEHVIAWACALALLSLVPLWPQLAHLRAAPDPGDPFFSGWRLAWISHQIVRAPGHLFDANIFYPTPLTLTYSDSVLLPGIVAAPLIWAGVDPVVVANLLLVAAFPLSALAFFFAARRLTGHLPASFVAGLMGGLAAFRFEHYSHLELQFFFWIPLALVAAMRVMTRPRVSSGVLFGLVVMGQCLSSMYFGGMLLTYLIPFTICIALGWRIVPNRSLVLATGAAAAVTALALVVLGLPYSQSRETRGERSLDHVQLYSAEPSDYLEAHYSSVMYHNLLHSNPQPERQLFPGATPLIFATAALSSALPVPAVAALVAGGFAFDWSMGMNGLTYGRLYAWLPPYRSMRAPARFAIFVAASLILLSAYGVRRLLGLMRSRRARAAVIVALAVAVLVDFWPSIPLRQYLSPIPSMYAAVSSDMVLAEFPMQDEANIAYMYFSTAHWAKLVNGYSGYVPAHYVWLATQMGTFPSADALDVLRGEGVTHITVNCSFYDRPSRCLAVLKVLDEGKEARLVSAGTWRGGEVRLYRLNARSST